MGWARIAQDHHMAWELAGQQAMSLLKRGEVEQSCALLDAWIARLPEPEQLRWNHAILLSSAAQAYIDAGRIDDAERVVWLRAQVGDETPLGLQDLSGLNILAELRESQGRLPEAEALYRREIDGFTALRGRVSRHVAVALNNLAYCLLQQGEYEESAACMVEAIDIARATQGPQHPDTALFVHTLGEIHLAAGDLAAALERLDEATDLYRGAHNDRFIASALSQAAAALAGLGDLDAAFARLDEARGEPGFGAHLLQSEEFAPLRGDPRFAAFCD